MNEKEMTIDDVFKMAEALSKKMHDFGTQKGMEEKLAKAILNATDPDSRFKADIAVKIGTAMDLMDMLVSYINKPVTAEGMLQRKLDGSVMLGNIPIPEGSLVEYWKDEKWNLGRVLIDKKTGKSRVIEPVSEKVVIDRIDQIKARKR